MVAKSMDKVFVVEEEKEVVEEKVEVIEETFVFFGRSWRRGSNRDCRRNLLRSNHSSRSWYRSRRVRVFDTLVCGSGVCGGGVCVVFWFVHQFRRAGCPWLVYGWLSVGLGA